MSLLSRPSSEEAQKAHVSLQTALLWKRKIQRVPEKTPETRCFSRCREAAVNPKDEEAHGLLSPVNRLCAQVKRRFAVHLRIHRKRALLLLSEKAFRRENGRGLSFAEYMPFFYGKFFLSGKPLRRREVFAL